MLRRISTTIFAAQQQRGAVAALAAVATPSRLCATSGNGNYSNNQRRNNNNYYNNNNNNNNNVRRNNNNNNNAGGGSNFRRQPRVLPPAFDIVHWNDENIAEGHLLRVIHQDSYIVLDYHKQAAKVKPEADAADAEDADGDAEAGGNTQRRRQRGAHAERVVTVTLPPVYIARFLGVLEGRSEKVDVQSRFTNATFTKKAGSSAAEKAFTLSCTSRRQTSGQQQTVDGQDVAEESVQWTVHLDAAESLMLHRFLTQALQYNTGFNRRA